MSKKRMAIETKRGKRSTKDENEYRYSITIEEVDGTVVKKEAVGENLEEALTRLQIIERRDTIIKFVEKVPQWVYLVATFAIFGGAALMSEFYNTASWISGTVGGILIISGVLYFINRWIENWGMADNS